MDRWLLMKENNNFSKGQLNMLVSCTGIESWGSSPLSSEQGLDMRTTEFKQPIDDKRR